MRASILFAISLVMTSSVLADFSLFGLLGDDASKKIQQRVPADTPLLAAGKLDPDVSLAHSNPTQDLAELQTLLTAELAPELANALQVLLTRTIDAIYVPEKRHAISMQDDSFVAFYFDGLHPVMRYELAKTGDLLDTLNEAGFTTLEPIEGYQVYRLILEEQDGISVDVAVNDFEVVWSLGLTQRADARLKELLLVKPKPLSASNRLQKLMRDNDFVGVAFEADFRLLAEQLWLGSASKLGQDMISLDIADADDFNDEAFLQCEQDVKALIAGVPRLIAGNTTLNQESAINRTILEFADGDLLSQIALLQGKLPQHEQGIASIGWGLNAGQIAPVLNAITKRFVNQPYTCEALEEARAEFDPQALLGIASATAFVQGIEGLQINLEKVTPLKTGQYEVHATLTLVGNSLGNILAPLGLFTGMDIPILSSQSPTGEVSIPANELVANRSAKLELLGDRLLITLGTPDTESIKTAELAPAITQFHFDHQQSADLVDMMSKTLPLDDASTCYDFIQLSEQLRRMGRTSSAIVQITDEGIVTQATTSGDNAPRAIIENYAGNYQVSEMTSDCAWVPAGTETLAPDGDGRYENGDYAQVYQWQHNGLQLKFSDINACEGDSCDEPLGDDQCTIVNRYNAGFDCLYSGDQPFILRYQKL
ncbi:hypothetical protein [Salinibius halmophilus]|uniref:hypothetical protein n=1 Tax=Salinibius halmophilus TaxID=1853216 RepID=UPI000E663224|nr:hypothetical protein [Salinibius halmophilus]